MILPLVLPNCKSGQRNVLSWMILALFAIAAAGVYSVLPFVLRTPLFAKFIDLNNFFKISLVVHVDLAVLIWFLASLSALLSLVTKNSFYQIANFGFWVAAFATLLITISPFVPGEAVLNNYIPILHNICFIVGIALFLSAILLQAILTICSYSQIKNNLIKLTIYFSALIFIFASIAIIIAAIQLKQLVAKRFIDLIEYYELLFWGAGHMLQFDYVQLLLISWMLVIEHLKIPLKNVRVKIIAMQVLNLSLVALAILGYFFYPLDSSELNIFFTNHMRYAGGILLISYAIWFTYALYKHYYPINKDTDFTAFYCSLLLIVIGGLIGYLIQGINVTIPAHYHGVIIGITVGIMGMFYALIPRFGFRAVNANHACRQLVLYTTGQIIHVVALAVSGGYGALRKNPGQDLSQKAKIFMSIMGIGGMLALAGGVYFVVLVIKMIRSNRQDIIYEQ